MSETQTLAATVLDELDALLAAATPGEWAQDLSGGSFCAGDVYAVESAYGVTVADPPDAAVIVALRNAAPRLLAAIRAAYALAEEMAAAGEQPDTHGEFDRGVGAHQRDAATSLRDVLDEALGATGE